LTRPFVLAGRPAAVVDDRPFFLVWFSATGPPLSFVFWSMNNRDISLHVSNFLDCFKDSFLLHYPFFLWISPVPVRLSLFYSLGFLCGTGFMLSNGGIDKGPRGASAVP